MKIITLCGSTRFKELFEEENKRLTLEGNIVISVSCFAHSGDKLTEDQKKLLDEIHLRKIDLSDEIFVIDGYIKGYGHYIGKSTQKEIDYARSKNKRVIFWSTYEIG